MTLGAVREPLLASLHLSAFGVLGVMVRSWLKVGFSCYSTDRLGVCRSLDEGALTVAFAPNALGCFVFGLLSTPTAAGVASLGDDRQVACLRRGHAWQTRPRLLLGLRTGFCGALTTWASWNQAMVVRTASGDLATALIGFLVGCQVAGASQACGQHAAAALSFWHARAVVPAAATDEEPLIQDESVLHASRWHADDVFVGLLLSALVVANSAILGTAPGDRHAFAYRSPLLAPAGVLLRWQLARLNSFHSWVPCGTLAANTAGCILDAAVAASAAPQLLATTLMDGLGGSLSTVSTVCNETSLLFIDGKRWRGYAYLTVTWLLGFGGAVAVYTILLPPG